MNPDEGEESWRTPQNLFDRVELEVHRVLGDDEDCEGPDWHGEVLLSILLPDLRKALREAGVDLPESGPFSREAGSLLDARRRAEAEAAKAAAEAADMQETALYRWYDKDDVLLYVGIAGNLGSRTKSHVKGSSWMVFVARSNVERFPRRSIALAAEEAGIKGEGPVFNQQHNNTPEARERLRAYLEAADRMDLLTPKMLAAIEEDQHAKARALAALDRESHVMYEEESEDEGELPAVIHEQWAAWNAEADGAWWRPWLYVSAQHQLPDDLLSLICPVLSAAEAEDQQRWWRNEMEQSGSAHPLIWASPVHGWKDPDGSTLFGVNERWSAHSDHTCAAPWDEFTPEAAATQGELIAALVAAGKCTAQAGDGRVDLDGFTSKNEARVAGAILSDLAWGHTQVARFCIELLKDPGSAL